MKGVAGMSNMSEDYDLGYDKEDVIEMQGGRVRDCGACNGTGIGMHGDPDRSVCVVCNGRCVIIERDSDYEDGSEN